MSENPSATIVKVALGVWLTGLLSGTPALAQELDGTLKKIKTSGTFTLGYRESVPPFSSLGPDKRPIGYSIDLCMRVASAVQKQLGIENLKTTWVPVTAENRVDMVVQGKIDIECGTTTASLSRQERVDFSLMTYMDGGTFLSTSGIEVGELKDFAGKRIAVIPGTTTEKALAEFMKQKSITVELIRVKDHIEGIAAIEGGKATAFASDQSVLVGLAMASKDPKRFFIANILFSYEPYGLMMRRNDSAFRLLVNRTLADLYRSGVIESIYDRWFGVFGKRSDALHMMYLFNGLPE